MWYNERTNWEKFLDHWYDFKWVYLLVFLLIIFIGCYVGYEYIYPCVYGHNEQRLMPIYGGNGAVASYYWADVFICDCRTVRDSIINK